jgi:hypothetical protein
MKTFKNFWIPAGVYPREDGGENDEKHLLTLIYSVVSAAGFFIYMILNYGFKLQT